MEKPWFKIWKKTCKRCSKKSAKSAGLVSHNRARGKGHRAGTKSRPNQLQKLALHPAKDGRGRDDDRDCDHVVRSSEKALRQAYLRQARLVYFISLLLIFGALSPKFF
ncbi:unnamed protein product [Camellia sinensis]